MARTSIGTREIRDGGVKRDDLNTDVPGQAVLTKVIAGDNISIAWTGIDAGTGDVTINGVSGGASLHIGVSPPLSPSTGQMWWDSVSGNLYVFYDDGDSNQWVPATVNPGPPGFGLSPTYFNLSNISGPLNVDLSLSDTQIGILTGNTTINLPALNVGETRQFTLILTNDATGSYAISAPNVQWIGKLAPSFDTTPNAINILLFRGIDGLWIGDGGAVE